MTTSRATKPLIVVCDDDSRLSRAWATSLDKTTAVTRHFRVESADLVTFKDAVTMLEERRRTARTNGAHEATRTLIDRADVLIVDYDLIDVFRDSYLTGESVAYLSRCYSSCGLILGLNQFGENSFDLTLAREARSYADFNVGVRQVVLPALWGSTGAGFRPWRWPPISDALRKFRRRAKQLQGALDESITAYFGFTDVETLPREVTTFIKVPGKDIAATTFRDFVTQSGYGLKRKDQTDDASVAYIAAARLSKWLEDIVLPAQDILVDAPHLVSRLPELLVGDASHLSAWDATTAPSLSALGIRHTVIKPFEFKQTQWLSRPAWFWRALRDAPAVQDLKQKRQSSLPDYVFCEDLSRFVARSDAREFVADVPSHFTRRYVSGPHTGKIASADRRFLAEVVYQPDVRFAL